MKKYFKTALLLASSVIAFSACQKEVDVVEESFEGDYIYSFSISNADNANVSDTKATLGDDGTNLYLKWENGDLFGAYATNGTNNSNNRPSTVAVSGDDYTLKVASTVELEGESSVYTYFPYNSGAGSDKTAAVIKIDPVQTQKSTGFDASVMPMAGEVYTTTTTLSKDEETEVGEIRFANLGSIVEFNIYSTSAIDEQIKSVQFNSTSGNLAGNYTLNLAAIDFEDESTLNLNGGSVASVKTDLVTPVAIPVSNTTDKAGTKVYMSIAPGDYAGSIVVTTTGHTYTFNVTTAKTFNRSKVKRLNANLSTAEPGDLPIEETWEVVTNASDFTEGTYVIISSDKASYLVNEEKASNPSSSTAHWDGSGKLTSVTSDAKWVATASGNGLQFKSFANESNILSMSTSTAQGVAVGTSTTNSTFTLVSNATLGGESGYIATTGNNRYLALYTNGTWRGYTINATSGYLNNDSNIKAAVFYKLADSRTALDTPVLTVNGTVVSWTSIANADSYLVTIGSDEYTLNTTSVDLDDYSLSDGEYTVSVVAVPSNTTLYKNSAAASTSVIIGNASGTSANPYSVSEALAEADKLSDGETTANEVYVSGIVSTVSSYNSTYKSITYSISADGTTTSELLIYGGLDIEGSDFTSMYDLAIGDEVVVKGSLKKYGTTLEMDKDNHVISNSKAPRYTITFGSVTNGTISASTSSAGAQAVITLTATPTTGYALDTWTVTNASTSESITVTDNSFTMPAANVNVTATFKEIGGSKTATFTFSSMGYANGDDVTTVTKDDNDNTDISLTFALGTNSNNNAPKYYTTGTGARMYVGNTLVVNGGSKTITSIAFTFSGSNTGTLTSSPEGYTQPKWTGSSNSVTFSNTGSTNRIQKITVTYN